MALTAHDLTNAVGSAAGLCSMVSFTPQLIKMIRDRRAEEVSLLTYVVTVIGFALWIAYGVMLGSWPVAVSNTVSLLLAGAILVCRLKFGDS